MRSAALWLALTDAPWLQLLSDNTPPTIMSLLFFLTIFRTQFNAAFFAAIVLLLFSKAALWVIEARVHFMEQSPADSRMAYWRLGSLIVLLIWIDATVTSWASQHTLQYGASLVLLFGCVAIGPLRCAADHSTQF